MEQGITKVLWDKNNKKYDEDMRIAISSLDKKYETSLIKDLMKIRMFKFDKFSIRFSLESWGYEILRKSEIYPNKIDDPEYVRFTLRKKSEPTSLKVDWLNVHRRKIDSIQEMTEKIKLSIPLISRVVTELMVSNLYTIKVLVRMN